MTPARASCRRVGCLAGALALVGVQLYLLTIHRADRVAVSSRSTSEVGPVGGPVALTQTFRVQQSGLDAVSLVLRPAPGATTDAPVVLEVAEMHGADAAAAFRMVRRMSDVATGRPAWWHFSPLHDSTGKTYRVRLSVPNHPVERGVFVRSTREEQYRDGVLAIDGREAWGDAVFDTDVAHGTLLHRAHRALRWPLWTVTALVCLIVALTGVAAHAMLARLSDAPSAGPLAPVNRAVDALAVLAVLIIGVALAVQWWRRPTVGGQEPGAVQLLDRFPDAVKRTSMPHLQDAFGDELLRVDGEWRCLLALPFSRVTWREAVLPDTRLRLSYALRPDVWHGRGDGAGFRIGIAHRGVYRDVLTQWLFPAERPGDRGLRAFELDLAPYAGEEVDIVLNTEPGPSGNAVGDAAVWCAPRLVRGPF